MSREARESSPSSPGSSTNASSPGAPGAPSSNGNGNGSHGSSPQELRAEVEHARGELADTVAELARKADVKSAARDKAARMKERARGAKQSRTRGGQNRHEHDGHQDGELKAVRTDDAGSARRPLSAGPADQAPPAVMWGATAVAGAAVMVAVLAGVRRMRRASGARTTARRVTQPARRSMAKARSQAGTRGRARARGKARPGRGARAARAARCARRG